MSGGDDSEIGRHPAYVWTMIPLCVLAVLLNVMVILAVSKYGRFKSSVDFFLVNLAVSEILQSSCVFPVHLKKSMDYHRDFKGGSAVCKITMFTPLVIVMSAILSMVVMAIDRLRCIVYQRTMDRRTALKLIGLIWITSLLVSSPQIYEYNIYSKFIEDINTTIQSCGSENILDNFETIYASIVFGLAYCVPLMTIIISYARILKFVWKNANRLLRVTHGSVVPGVAQGQAMKNITVRKVKVLKLLINITASFTILWTPYFVLFALTEIMHLDDSAFHLQWPHVIGRILTVLSTCINPIIVIMFSDQFRARLKNLFSCKTSSSVDLETIPSEQTPVDRVELNQVNTIGSY